ncbi:MAG: YnbE family lipoprotein [Aliidiomarina sp.]|nr:YnbE family lipoprotein [Aliidiomarina sp.]MCH8500495.1 YnbE family lipoprotein [Aliidiomarina sp.]
MRRVTTNLAMLAILVTGTLMVSACTPTVQVAAPQEPITINLNVKIEHEIYIRVARELDELFSESSGLF